MYVSLLFFVLEKIDKVVENEYNILIYKYYKQMDKTKIIKMVASVFHEEWRKNRLQNGGKYEPMIEKSEDKERNNKNWTDLVDIANTKFEDLPSNWKRENLEAAKVAVELVYQKVIAWEDITPEMVEELSSVVHEVWMKRNSWKKENRPHLFVPYSELSEEEKAKDRDQILQAIEIIKSEK